ncbi:MAG: hypothetical protein ACOVNS_04045, partial [Erythrobacter sp.]
MDRSTPAADEAMLDDPAQATLLQPVADELMAIAARLRNAAGATQGDAHRSQRSDRRYLALARQ